MIRAAAAAVVLCGLAITALLPPGPAPSAPLWPGARYTVKERDRAVREGLLLIYRIARDPQYFAEWGHDLLGPFAGVALTSSNGELVRLAAALGQERAREWRRLHPTLPRDASANSVAELMFGDESCDRLGVHDPRYTAALRQAASRYPVADFLLFDPNVEPPPSDIPDDCPRCDYTNARGARVCSRCGAALTMRSRYSVWLDALITTYTADRQEVPVGAHYADVLRWLPAMRPYPPRDGGRNPDYDDAIYAVTHVVYTLNQYGVYRLPPDCLAPEFAYLRDNVYEAIAVHDPETMGEYMDTLRSFGFTLADPLLQTGIEYLLHTRNRDGSWGTVKNGGVYPLYHPTWTAIDGLREYRWEQTLPCAGQ
jgi:hypothetical protein